MGLSLLQSELGQTADALLWFGGARPVYATAIQVKTLTQGSSAFTLFIKFVLRIDVIFR